MPTSSAESVGVIVSEMRATGARARFAPVDTRLHPCRMTNPGRMTNPVGRRYRTEPDYTRAALEVTPAQRSAIVEALTVLYGELDANAYYWEVERLMQVHHAYKPDEMLRAEAEFDARDRFTEQDVVAITYGDLIDSPKTHP